MKTILVAAAALGLSVSGAFACNMQKMVKTDTMTVASVDTKVMTPVDPTTTASVAKPEEKTAEE